MEKRKLEVYTFNLFEKRKPDTKIDFKDVFGKDLFSTVHKGLINFLDDLPPKFIGGKTIKIAQNGNGKSILEKNESLKIISGKLKIGDDDGKEQTFVTADKKKDLVYTKKKGVSAERPFFFMMLFPENKKYGFIVLEREGKHSCKRTFIQAFKIFVRERFSNLIVRESNFIEDEVVKNYLTKGKYNSIKIIRQHLPKELSDKYLGEFHSEGDYEIQLNIVPKKKTTFPKSTKRKILKSIETYDGFFESPDFKDIGFDENTNIKVESTYDGNTKTIDLSDTMKIRPYYVVDVEINDQGFSKYKSIKSQAINLIKGFNLDLI